MKIAIVGTNPDQLDSYPVLKSIQRVFKNLSLALKSEANVTKTWEDGFDFSKVDVIVGTYEALRIRHKLHLDIPVLVLPLGDMPNGGLMLFAYHGLLKPFDSLIFSCSSDLVIFNRLVEHHNLITKIIPLPVDCDFFYKRSIDRSIDHKLVRKKYRIPEQGRLLFYAGRISLQKNLHVLVKIFEEVAKEKEVILCIAGTSDQTSLKEFGICGDDYAYRLEEMIRNKGLIEKVRFIGYLDDNALAEMYSISDLFVNPTLHCDENFGFSQVEAQSCGLPVIASKWGGIKDTVLHGETGFLMETILTDYGPRLEWRSGVRYILNLLSDDLLWRKISDRCRTHALSNFSIKAVGRQMKEVLEHMLYLKSMAKPTVSPAVKMKEEVKSYIINAIKPAKGGKIRYHVLPVTNFEEAKWFYETRMEPYSSITSSEMSNINEITIPYKAIDLEIHIEKGIVKLSDLIWNGEIQLDPESLSFLLLSDGKKCVGTICDEVGISKEKGIEIFSKLVKRGLILHVKEE